MGVSPTSGTARSRLEAGVIDIDIASKDFGGTKVLKNVRFSMKKGECLAILGESGIGKSTLLRLIAGIDKDYEGTTKRPDRMAIVFQEPTLLSWRSALQNILLVHEGLEKAEALDMMARVGLSEKVNLFPGQLSLGQQRRLALARAFAGRPNFLIMDEPFVSLDEKTASEMIALTRVLMKDLAPATLFVTHEKKEAAQLADRILELTGTPATIREKKS